MRQKAASFKNLFLLIPSAGCDMTTLLKEKVQSCSGASLFRCFSQDAVHSIDQRFFHYCEVYTVHKYMIHEAEGPQPDSDVVAGGDTGANHVTGRSSHSQT